MPRILAVLVGIALLGCEVAAWGQSPAPGSSTAGTTETRARSRLADQFYIPGYYEPRADGGYTWKEGFWANRQKDWRWIPSGWVQRPTGWVFRHGYWVTTKPRTSLGGDLGPAPDVRYVSDVYPAPGGYGVPVAGAGASPLPSNAGADGLKSTYRTELPPGTQFQAANQVLNNAAIQPRMGAPAATYYIGNSLPGTSYPSLATQPAGIPGQSHYIGNSLPGTSYPSLATQPTGIPGQTYYIGNSLPGTSYPSLVGSGTSVGGYGYGNAAPGSSGGQIATPGNGLPSP